MATEIQEVLKRCIEQAKKNKSTGIPKVYECPKCKDTEFIFYNGKDGNQYAKECECRQFKIARRLLERSGISEEFQTKTFNNFNDRGIETIKKAKQQCIDYFTKFKESENTRNNSILITGAVGAGKTHLGMAISNNLLKRNVSVLYMEYRLAATQLKQIVTDEIQYNDKLSRYKNARVLFIDDLLKGKTTEADINLLYEIINHRYLNKLPMIVSTEKDVDQLIEFDEAIASRIIEMSKGNIVEFKGDKLNYRIYA